MCYFHGIILSWLWFGSGKEFVVASDARDLLRDMNASLDEARRVIGELSQKIAVLQGLKKELESWVIPGELTLEVLEVLYARGGEVFGDEGFLIGQAVIEELTRSALDALKGEIVSESSLIEILAQDSRVAGRLYSRQIDSFTKLYQCDQSELLSIRNFGPVLLKRLILLLEVAGKPTRREWESGFAPNWRDEF